MARHPRPLCIALCCFGGLSKGAALFSFLGCPFFSPSTANPPALPSIARGKYPSQILGVPIMGVSLVPLPVLLAWCSEVEAATHECAALVTALSGSDACLYTALLNYLTVLGVVLSTEANFLDLKLYT